MRRFTPNNILLASNIPSLTLLVYSKIASSDSSSLYEFRTLTYFERICRITSLEFSAIFFTRSTISFLYSLVILEDNESKLLHVYWPYLKKKNGHVKKMYSKTCLVWTWIQWNHCKVLCLLKPNKKKIDILNEFISN